MEVDNRSLRDDLRFSERLLPADGVAAAAIRRLQAEILSGTQLKWQVLIVQSAKNDSNFNGSVELMVSGTLTGKPWSMALPVGLQRLQSKQHQHVEGVPDLLPLAVVKKLPQKF